MSENLYCDNYATCGALVFDQGSPDRTRFKARARGWHIYDGMTYGGEQHHGVLCPRCVGTTRKLSPAPDALEQEGLF